MSLASLSTSSVGRVGVTKLVPMEPWFRSGSRKHDAYTFSAGAIVRWIRWRRGFALAVAARGPILLVSDLARPAGGSSPWQQARRRATARPEARRRRADRARLRPGRRAHLKPLLCLGHQGDRGDEGSQPPFEGRAH